MLQSRDVILTKNKFDVKKQDCIQDNFETFKASVGNTENNKAEYNDEAPEYSNAKDLQVAIDEESERSQRARRHPDRLNV